MERAGKTKDLSPGGLLDHLVATHAQLLDDYQKAVIPELEDPGHRILVNEFISDARQEVDAIITAIGEITPDQAEALEALNLSLMGQDETDRSQEDLLFRFPQRLKAAFSIGA